MDKIISLIPDDMKSKIKPVCILMAIGAVVQMIIGPGILYRVFQDGHKIIYAVLLAYWMLQGVLLLLSWYFAKRVEGHLPELNGYSITWLQVHLLLEAIVGLAVFVNGVCDSVNTFDIDWRYGFALTIDCISATIIVLTAVDVFSHAPRTD